MLALLAIFLLSTASGGLALTSSATQYYNQFFLTLQAPQTPGESSKCVFQNGPYFDSTGILEINTDIGTSALVSLNAKDASITLKNTSFITAGDSSSLLYISNNTAGSVSGIKFTPTNPRDRSGTINLALENNGQTLCQFAVFVIPFNQGSGTGTPASANALKWNLQIAGPYPGQNGRTCNTTFKQDVGVGVGGEPTLNPSIRLLVPFGLNATINLGELNAAVGILRNEIPASIVVTPGQGQDAVTALTYAQVLGVFPASVTIAYGQYDPSREAPPCQVPVQFIPVGNSGPSLAPAAGRKLLLQIF